LPNIHYESNKRLDIQYCNERKDDFFDPYIFFSELYVFNDQKIENEVNSYLYGFESHFFMTNIHFVNYISTFTEKHAKRKLRNGDVVMFFDTKKDTLYFPKLSNSSLMYQNKNLYKFSKKHDSISKGTSLNESVVIINNYPHSRYFEYSTEFISVNYLINFDEPIKKIYSGIFYNVFLMSDGWRIITFSNIMDKYLSLKNKRENRYKYSLKFMSSSKAWFNELLKSRYLYNYNKNVSHMLPEYNVKYYKPMMEHITKAFQELGEEKIKEEIEFRFTQSSKVLIEPLSSRILFDNVISFGSIFIDNRWINASVAISEGFFD
jgi:hypothetical protein